MSRPAPWNAWNHWVIESACAPHRNQGVPPGIARIRDVEFRRIGDRPLRLEVWRPEDPEQVVPAILWICGGGWRNMDPRGAHTVSAWLAGEGYAIIGVEYRCSGEAVFPACIEDIQAGLDHVRAHAGQLGIDPERIGVWGDSAGGHLAALLGVTADWDQRDQAGPLQDVRPSVRAVCAFYPPVDLAAMAELDLVQELIGGSLQQRPEAYRLASPICHVGPDSPPHLLAHGTADEIVPFDQSVRYAAALRQAGVEVSLVELPGIGHDGRTLHGCGQLKRIVSRFFARHLSR
jgi:acetyl esterase/lipase